MYRDLRAAYTRFGIGLQSRKLGLWGNLPGGALVVDGVRLTLSLNVVFLGTFIRGEPVAVANHRAAIAWNKFWAMRGHLCTQVLSICVPVQKLRAEFFLVFTWGWGAWQMQEDVLGTASSGIARMARVMMRLYWADISGSF